MGCIRFNSDNGNNYSHRRGRSGTTDGTGTSTNLTYTTVGGTGTNDVVYAVGSIVNNSDKEKLVITEAVDSNTAGAGNAPQRREAIHKWANTSDYITSIQMVNINSGSWNTGSYITVWGANVAPATADVITVDSLAAKKHLMIQAKIIASSGDIRTQVIFNNDTGNNYAFRSSHNGGSDSTDTSQASLKWTNTSGSDSKEFHTMYVINEASKEKLVILEGIIQATAGAGNAPGRKENVGKWANTSNQITRVDITNGLSSYFAEGSEVTVYGTD